MLGIMAKQPIDNLDYDIDFAPWLPIEDKIIGVITKVEPDNENGIDAHSAMIFPDEPKVKIWLNGGENGITYKITVTVNTEYSRIKETEFKVRVRDC